MADEIQVDLGYVPKPHQLQVHEEIGHKRFQVRVWHRRAGKTLDSVYELVLRCLKNPRRDPPPRYMFISPELKMARRDAWPYMKAFGRRVPGSKPLEGEVTLELPNRGRIICAGAAEPDSLRGPYNDGVVIDEVADMKPEAWTAVIRPSLMDYKGWARFIGTPKGLNAFSDLFFRARAGELGDEWGTSLLRWDDTGMLDPAEVEAARREMTPALFAQELECDFNSSADDHLIPLADILRAQRREYGTLDYNLREKVMGVDVARRPDGDRSVIAMRQGPIVFRMAKFRGLSLAEYSDNHIAQRIVKWQPDKVFVDSGGMGQGVYDRLVQLGFGDLLVAIDFGSRAADSVHFQNRRTEMWWLMAQAVKRELALPEDVELVRDLATPRVDYMSASDRLSLESKDELRKRGEKSPDCGDALALTYAAPVAIRSPMERAAEQMRAIREAGGKRATMPGEDDLQPFSRELTPPWMREE